MRPQHTRRTPLRDENVAGSTIAIFGRSRGCASACSRKEPHLCSFINADRRRFASIGDAAFQWCERHYDLSRGIDDGFTKANTFRADVNAELELLCTMLTGFLNERLGLLQLYSPTLRTQEDLEADLRRLARGALRRRRGAVLGSEYPVDLFSSFHLVTRASHPMRRHIAPAQNFGRCSTTGDWSSCYFTPR